MKTITMTSKGQITIPVEAQRSLGLRPGDKLVSSFDPETRAITLTKPMTVDEFVAFVNKIPRKKVKPLLNVDEYYQQNRKPRT